MNWSHFHVALAVAGMLGVAALQAQDRNAPEFEVASLKPHPVSRGGIIGKVWLPVFQCPPGANCGLHGNRFREERVSLAELIIDA